MEDPTKSFERTIKSDAVFDRSIDIVIATHPDQDHTGGLSAIFDGYEISKFIEPGVISDTDTYKFLKDLVKKEKSEQILARRGMVLNLDNGVYLKFYFQIEMSPE